MGRNLNTILTAYFHKQNIVDDQKLITFDEFGSLL